jgi:predicted secreted protein
MEEKESSVCYSRDSLAATHDNTDGRWQSSYSGSFEGGQGVVLDVVSV